VNVTDRGLPVGRIHPNISLCEVGAVDNKSDYTDFSLNISEDVIVIIPGPGGGSGGGSGGGGGGIIPSCDIKWVCLDWVVCENAILALEDAILVGGDYRSVTTGCDELGWGGSICGYQTRSCFDLNECNITIKEPSGLQSCYFTTDPSCFDGIKNCHGGGCEFLVDCGGPCGACPTCSDGIQNQNEGGIDCGGPCPKQCEPELPSERVGLTFVVIVSIVAIILLVIVALKLRNIFKLGEKLQE